MPVTRTSSADSRARRGLTPLAAPLAALLLGWALPAQAALTIEVEPSTAAPGSTGSFDVILADSGGTFNVASFSVELSINGASGVTFSAVDATTTAAPYLFGTIQNPPLSFDTFPNNADFTASDSYNPAPGFVTLNTNDRFGLVHVTYEVAPGTQPGTVVPVSFTPGGNTDLSTVTGGAILFATADGTITVATVPEPGSAVLLGLGSLILFAGLRRRGARG